MKNTKKMISLALAIMLLCSFSVTSNASTMVFKGVEASDQAPGIVLYEEILYLTYAEADALADTIRNPMYIDIGLAVLSGGLLFTAPWVGVTGTGISLGLTAYNINRNAIAQQIDDAADGIRYNGKKLRVRFFRSDFYGNLSPINCSISQANGYPFTLEEITDWDIDSYSWTTIEFPA
ncbi:hypothetical protein HZI73_18780 [Vallitalea pronyensis]|uniref:Uncharacterized protein n=1 Tax=Vallitalea pronyensis TaxID=1348613 RepID=A0A8J8MME8_9FIRM|nr:hypothetical protein [Vallitalea pronyensis]QUI24211.1 hypothetical protein HZI73_18780 [Vallitalea pronyensis]